MPPPKSITVFVVEDSPAIRTVLTQRIEDNALFSVVGYAETASATVTALAQNLPDVVIIDLQLKEGTGYDILSYLRNGVGKQRPHSVVLTNFASPAHRKRAMELGASSFFDKSMQFDEMLDSLQAWAESKNI